MRFAYAGSLLAEEGAMWTVTSADGTQIAYQREGFGPAVVLVGGGLDDGSENAVLVPALADEFTYTTTRRGRGGSGDTQPYTVQRELEDLAAVLDAAGVLGDGGSPSGRLANIRQETMVLTRSTSDPYMRALPVEFFAAAADAVAAALPHVVRHTIDAPGHAVDAAAAASPVRAFFAGWVASRTL